MAVSFWEQLVSDEMLQEGWERRKMGDLVGVKRPCWVGLYGCWSECCVTWGQDDSTVWIRMNLVLPNIMAENYSARSQGVMACWPHRLIYNPWAAGFFIGYWRVSSASSETIGIMACNWPCPLVPTPFLSPRSHFFLSLLTVYNLYRWPKVIKINWEFNSISYICVKLNVRIIVRGEFRNMEAMVISSLRYYCNIYLNGMK